MKDDQTNWLARALVFAILSAGIGCLILWGTTEWRSTFAQSREEQSAKQAVPSRESANLNSLTSLLASDGVSVRETTLLPSRVENARMVLVRLESFEKPLAGNDFLMQMPSDSSLSLLEAKISKGGLTRQRAFELSPNQILTVAVNRDRQMLWWSLLPDPRLFRAETADQAGNLSGQNWYRTAAEMLVTYPADETITELRFYHPNSDGQTYNLQLIGNLALPAIEK